MENGILIRKTAKNKQIILPENYHQIVFSGLHETLGHLGSEKDSDLAKQRFYFFIGHIWQKISFFMWQKNADVLFQKSHTAWDCFTNTNWNEISFRDGVTQFVTPW